MNNVTLGLFTAPKITLPSRRAWYYDRCLQLLPRELEPVIPWTDKYYRVNGGIEYFKTAESPWLIEPLQMMDDPLIASETFIKPIQVGGTSCGEIMLLRRALDSHGQLSYHWPTDDKAKDRWEKWTEKHIRACAPLKNILPWEYENMLIKFKTGLTFSMVGVFNPGNLDSDTVGIIINEEVHQWETGRLQKARGRQTRVDFPKFITISNAGHHGSDLHTEYNNGTQQHYENYCPGCKQHHTMRTRWEDSHPDLGGLRYDSEGCKRPDGTFDYNRLVPTIRYQFPCGYPMPDDIALRRESATRGRYSQPYNTGAQPTNRSHTLQAVACHNIRWLDLIQEKHNALRSLKTGDDKAWKQYCQERESIFYNPEDHRPFTGAVLTTTGAVKNRTGLPDEAAKAFAFDWQQGFKHLGELTHYWGIIESVRQDCSSQVLWAGKVDDETELIATLQAHGITEEIGLADGFIDASKNTKHILSFCYRNGINAVQGNASGKGAWKWPDGSTRYYSTKKYIYRELNMPPKYDLVLTRQPNGDRAMMEDPDEPYIILYNKAGLLKNHFFLREMKSNILAHNPKATPDQYIERIIPGDIGEDYLKHHAAWERDHTATAARKMGEVEGFKQVRRADHLMSCTTYIDLGKDICGWLGDQLARLGMAAPAGHNQGNQ